MNCQTFKNEDELRTLWSNPLTRRILLEKLAEAGFGKEELTILQKLIDAEKATCLMCWNMYLTAT